MSPHPDRTRGRGRFAPSPTGPLHLGSLLAAMGSYLQARHAGGQWLVRIEDLDPPREVPGASDTILRSLEAHGFEWDGDVAYQSTRHHLYLAALEKLQKAGLVYACRCSRREISAALAAGNSAPAYPGTCSGAGLADGPGRALRMRARAGDTCFEDALQGRQCQDVAGQVGDFVVRRRDGQIAYQLAVVVDDAAQGITEVVRGCDLLDSTPRQILLQEALGFPHPGYMHLPLVINRGREKLGKQTGARPLDDRRPLASLLAAHRLLGQSNAGDPQPADLREFWASAIARWEPARLLGRRELAATGLSGT